MRLHTLSVTAFGPFADTVSVDFDALGRAGLFLLSGATGAGKTSILDAVCFGLYGEVPGDRNAAKRLRSDQAGAGVSPVVDLDVTLAGRRLRLRRSPQWHRPKKRGSGTTNQQASVLIQERVGDAWVTRTTRLDEAGHLITGLLGMTLNQFCQVALLPQGRFQAFLRARSEERQHLLQQLFRTQRFSDIESWLAEHRRSLRRTSAAVEATVLGLATRLSEASGETRPENRSPDLEFATEIRHWSADVVRDADAARLLRLGEQHDCAESVTRANAKHEDAVRRARLREAFLAAEAEQRALIEDSVQQSRDRVALTLAAKAEALSHLVRLWEAGRQAHESVVAERDRLSAAAEIDSHDLQTEHLALTEALDRRRDELAALRALIPQAQELDRLSEVRRQWSDEIEQLIVAVHSAREQHAQSLRGLQTLQTALVQAQQADSQLADLRGRAAIMVGLVGAHDQVLDLAAEAESTGIELAAQRAETLALKEEWLAIREARLNGMAAEIAGRLVVGGCCPVCGSAEHPHVAQPMNGAPDAGSERAARAALDDGEAAQHAREDRHRETTVRLDLAREAVGDTNRADCVAQADELTDELERVTAIAELLQPTKADLASAEADFARTERELQGHRFRLGAVEAGLEQSEPLFARLRDELDGALSRHDADTLAAAIRTMSAQVKALEAVLSANQRFAASYADLERNRRALSDASLEVGFKDIDELRAALLSAEQRLTIEHRVAAYDARMLAVQGQLSSPELQAAASGDPSEAKLTGTALTAAQSALRVADSQLAEATNRSSRTQSLAIELGEVLDEWEPVLAELELAIQMAGLAEGTSPDNTLQMRLSAFVLAYRLGQVVSAANQRLVRMSDQRYSLEHSDQRGAGERRGGLSLLVRDDWSGESRDPATLSGGETFVVSLALALGLADVISQEVGGADLDTLFVDEGFGALDAETLDDVMDTLDSLREGGRVVGVVSHVAEMRHRIPTRLHVTKRRSGSTVSLIHGS